MPNSTPISVPAGYAPAFALGFSDSSANLSVVSEATRLPVAMSAAAPAPLAGQSAVSQVVGPFDATAGRTVQVLLDGEWEGKVQLLRSIDGGVTRLPLRVAGTVWAEYTASGLEQAWSETEEGASFYLDIALTSGTVAFRVSQ
jgi:hypothetical protein